MLHSICFSCGAEVEGEGGTCPACGKCSLLDNRFRLLQVLGKGAMGTTYKAECLDTGALVAVKELPFCQIQSLKTMDLFEREARVLKSLSHPQIPAYHEDFFTGEGKHTSLIIVQEFIDGVTLEEESRTKTYSEAEVLRDLDDLLGILTYTHSCHPPVIHRDLKPANIIRRKSDGKLALIDFGGAKHSLGGGSTVAGTFGYMAPEQYRGEASPASDLYALGVVAVRLLTGKEPEELMGSGIEIEWESEVGKLSPRLEFTLSHLLRKDSKPPRHVKRSFNPALWTWMTLAALAAVLGLYALKEGIVFAVILWLLVAHLVFRGVALFTPKKDPASHPPKGDAFLKALSQIHNRVEKSRVAGGDPSGADVIILPSDASDEEVLKHLNPHGRVKTVIQGGLRWTQE